MPLQVYNTLGRTKQPFQPLHPPNVGMYECGLTVYDYAHIGHARTAVAFDILRGWLQHLGYHVTYVKNVTDVDDKIINRARELGVDPQTHAAQWTEICNADLARLGVRPPDFQPKVTTHMPEIVAFIGRLLQRGMAYPTPAGNVYYEVARKADYGKLSNRSPDELLAGARVEPMEDKRDPKDFALWKASKPGEPSWDSPWGPGRPGWHIECSAMSSKYLGDSFDVHGGGLDLIFPHHENEIAQSEGATGKRFVTYWLHSGFLTVGGVKMSKSLHNFITLQELLKDHDPEAIRFFYAYTHYRSGIDYTPGALADAKRGLERLRRLRDELERAHRASAGGTPAAGPGLEAARVQLEASFTEAMNDDFNTRMAIAALFDFVTAVNKALAEGVPGPAAKRALATYLQLCRVLTLFPESAPGNDSGLAAWVEAKLQEREQARRRKDFATSDAIRAELLARGIEVSDAKDRTTWRKGA